MNEPIRVLVVDNEEIIREIVGDILGCEGNGFETTMAGSCEEAMRLAKRGRFDVVFLDVCLDDGSGVDLLQSLRPHQPDARIYMITGFKVDAEIQQALATGATGVISKPFRVRDILAALHGTDNAPVPVSE